MVFFIEYSLLILLGPNPPLRIRTLFCPCQPAQSHVSFALKKTAAGLCDRRLHCMYKRFSWYVDYFLAFAGFATSG